MEHYAAMKKNNIQLYTRMSSKIVMLTDRN